MNKKEYSLKIAKTVIGQMSDDLKYKSALAYEKNHPDEKWPCIRMNINGNECLRANGKCICQLCFLYEDDNNHKTIDEVIALSHSIIDNHNNDMEVLKREITPIFNNAKWRLI